VKVTEVSPQKKNPRRFNVFLDGQFAFGADEDLIVGFRLLPGKEVSPTEVEKLIYEAEVGKLMERVYGLLNVRARSEKEIRDYLKRLSFKRKVKEQDEISEMTTEQLIERLKNKGLLNDEEFATTWVDARRRSKQKGSRALQSELAQKGIDRKTVQKVMEENQVDEEKLAKEALEKKMRVWQNLPEQEFKKKATDFLLRRGFDYFLVKKVVTEQLLSFV
jgi:regulatory protein